ncbi:hypothetical protein FZC79_22000 [Rossellomorea vietnamensis]|uniref:Uncharacterized protein n=1 Tax=Rossellomorea vietnamensis TaxID=218284 RepID=A0A5D4K782_9BACI|nr:hypothetical protein [Rossellomorea vietnamensis]TYR72699.1 hypothetical protein FZC79_22000 [Rossellomorea vietnamensis]
MNKAVFLKDFLINNIEHLETSSSSGTHAIYPTFDLHPRDFLKFAKNELENFTQKKDKLIHIINCLSHLKRALDCQLDSFFHHFGLYSIVRKNNLKFDKKMDFLKDIGVIESASLSRLNRIRNKMEHDYKIPDIQEIEVYYDLVVAFISVIESTITMFLSNYHVQIGSNNENSFRFFDLEYKFNDGPKITFYIVYQDKKKFNLEVNVTERKEFVYFLRALIFMSKLEYMRHETIIEHLSSE